MLTRDVELMQQLLPLVKSIDNGKKALEVYIQLCATRGYISDRVTLAKTTNAILQSLWSQVTVVSDAVTKTNQNEKDHDKQLGLLSAKVAQSIIKMHGSSSQKKDAHTVSDVLVTLDLASMSLAVVMKNEHEVHLGELVIENMLYQVMKQYSECAAAMDPPRKHNTYTSVLDLLTRLHDRLWHHHHQLCRNRLPKPVTKNPFNITDLVQSCIFPKPQTIHSLQYTRLLISVMNIVVNLLLAHELYQDILSIAISTLQPWITYLSLIPGVDPKLAPSYNDRVFRVLWKCGTAIDARETSDGCDALQFRVKALHFMLKCPNYTHTYYLQQVYRVGMQYDKRNSKDTQDKLYSYYLQVANLLYENYSTSMTYTSISLQTDVIHWLDHFAQSCIANARSLESLLVLQHGIDYASTFVNDINALAISGCYIITSVVLLLGLQAGDLSLTPVDIDSSAFYSRTQINKDLLTLIYMDTTKISNGTSDLLGKTTNQYINRLSSVITQMADLTQNEVSESVSLLLCRSFRRIAVSAYNTLSASNDNIPDILYEQGVSSFSTMDNLLQLARKSSSNSNRVLDTVVATASRLCRLHISLGVRACGNIERTCRRTSGIETIKTSIDHFARELHVVLNRGDTNLLNVCVADLQTIAKECFGCAMQFYQANNYRYAAQTLQPMCTIVKRYIDHLMDTTTDHKVVATALCKFQVDSIASLLAYCHRKNGNQVDATSSYADALFYGSLQYELSDAKDSIKDYSEQYITTVVRELRYWYESDSTKQTHQLQENIKQLASRLLTFQQKSLEKLLWEMDCVLTRMVNKLRMNDREEIQPSSDLKIIEFFISTQRDLWRLLLTQIDASDADALLTIVDALASRHSAFATYYHTEDAFAAIILLDRARNQLGTMIDRLKYSNEASARSMLIDMGGAYCWRGVLSMEIAQFSQLTKEACSQEPTTEQSALMDFNECIQLWQDHHAHKGKSATSYGRIFDINRIIVSLESIHCALSLFPHLSLEVKVHDLMLHITAMDSGSSTIALGRPLKSTFEPDLATCMIKQETSSLSNAKLEFVDAEVRLSLAFIHDDEIDKARAQLAVAYSLLDVYRAQVVCQTTHDLTVYKAVAMREILIHMVSGEVLFREGSLRDAIEKLKAALGICWKLSKRFGSSTNPHRCEKNGNEQVHSSSTSSLPSVVIEAMFHSCTKESRRKILRPLLECCSWDVIFVAKVVLCRLATLHTFVNQPHRSSAYYYEAMELVNELNTNIFVRHRLFVDFAQLQVLAMRTNHATAVHRFTTPYDLSIATVGDLSASELQLRCDEIIQRGDIAVLDNDLEGAMYWYEHGKTLLCAYDSRSRTRGLDKSTATCMRKIVSLQVQNIHKRNALSMVGTNDRDVDALLANLKMLKNLTKKRVKDIVEYLLCLCQIVQASIALLRLPSSTKAFLPPTKVVELAEEIFHRGDHLGITYVCCELRKTLGMAYLVAQDLSSRTMHNDRDRAWLMVSLLANCSTIETHHPSKDVDEEMSSPLKLEDNDSSPSNNSPSPALKRYVDSVSDGLRHIPMTWMTISITIGPLDDMMISIIPATGLEPVSFWVGKIEWRCCMEELQAIISASRETLFGHSVSDSEEWSSERKKGWWSTRKGLDDRLAKVISAMQTKLGFWRSLFAVDASQTNTNVAIEECIKIVKQTSTSSNDLLTPSDRSKWLLEALIKSNNLLSDSEILDAIDHIAVEEGISLSPHIATNVLQVIRRTEGTNGKVSSPDDKSSGRKIMQTDRTSTILILDHRLEQFPWEGLDVLQNEATTRMPSLELLLRNTSRHLTSRATSIINEMNNAISIRPNYVSFLVNPAGDLYLTERNMTPVIQQGEETYQWKGVIGSVPEENTIRDFLLSSDLFIYCGHGAGEKYFHRDKILTLATSGCSAALLFGCSSGHVEREGIFGPYGATLSYLRAGSASVMAMLWDVTDKDVDLMAIDLLESWILSPPATRQCSAQKTATGRTLAAALQSSRQRCKLKNLNGLAAVCYGLPLVVTEMDGCGDQIHKLKRQRRLETE